MIKTVKIKGNGYLVNGTILVPKAEGNKDYEAVKQFIADGIVEPEFTDAELLEQAKASMESAIQNHIDKQAQSLGYDDINSIAKYLRPTSKYYDECVRLGDWCDIVWDVAIQTQKDVEDGTIPIPTVDELIAMLPVYGA